MRENETFARNAVRVWLRQVIEDKGWTANEWAVSAGTSPTNLTRLLAGQGSTPNVETIMKLARIARSQPNLVLGEVSQDAPPVAEHPNFCPECGHDLRPVIRPPRKVRQAS